MHVVVYSRHPCPLCDEALAILERYRKQYSFSIEVKDVDADEALVREHGEWVPVVLFDGNVRFRGHINEVLLRRILDA